MFHLRLQRNIFPVGILLLSLLLSSCVLTSEGPVLQEESKETFTLFSDKMPDITGEYVFEENKGKKKALGIYPINTSRNAFMLETDEEDTARVVLVPLKTQNMFLLELQDPTGRETKSLLAPVRITEKGIVLYHPPAVLRVGHKQWNNELWKTLLVKHNIVTTSKENTLAAGVKKESLLAALDAMAAADAMGDGVLLTKVGAVSGDIEKTKRSQAFLKLVKTASPEAVQAALKEGIDLNVTDENGRTALMLAAQHNPSAQVVTMLLKAGAALDVRDKWENNALLWAAGNNKDVVEALLKAGADPKSKNFIGSTTLHIFASTSTHKDVLPLLLSAGVDIINAKSIHGRTPVMSALFNKASPDMVDLLIKAGADVHATTADAGNILTSGVMWCASKPENTYLITRIQDLIARKVDVNIPDKDGKTALHYALGAKHMDLVDMLLQAGANVNSVGKDGKTMLHSAIETKQTDLLDALLKIKADVNTPDRDGKTALHYAIETQQADLLKTLLQAGAKANVKDKTGMTPLSALLNIEPRLDEKKAYSLSLQLIKAGADINSVGNDGNTLLTFLAENTTNVQYLIELLDMRADPAHKNNAGKNALQLATDNPNLKKDGGQSALLLLAVPKLQHPESIERLVRAGADINARDSEDKTVLHKAAQLQNAIIIQKILALGATVNAHDKEGNNALMIACAHNTKDVVEALLKGKADVKSKNNIGRTPLHFFAHSNQHKEILPMLLHAGADINAKSAQGDTPVMMALFNEGPLDMIELLIDAGADIQATSDDGNILTLSVKSYLEKKHYEYLAPRIHALIKRSVDVNVPDKNGKTALHHALGTKHMPFVDVLLQAGAKANTRDSTGATPLSTLLNVEPRFDVKTHYPLALQLIKAGADINSVGKEGKTVLLHTIEAKQMGLAGVLLQAGAKADIKDKKGLSPLSLLLNANATSFSARMDDNHSFDEAKYYPLALQLLKAGANVNDVDISGNTLLTFLATSTKNQVRLVELLDMGADPAHKNRKGKNALQLVENNWNLKKDGENSSLLFLTAHKVQHAESIERLVRAGADINARDKEGRTALHNAANAQGIAIIQKMLAMGAIVDTRTQKGGTPLINAAGHNTNPEVIQALLQAGADIHAKNADGNTPYMFAAWHNPKKEILEILRKAGADPLYRNPRGETALMLAAQRNTPEIVRIIIESGADVRAVASNGSTAFLHATEFNKNIEVMKLLVQHGANPFVVMENGNNALMLTIAKNENPAVIDFLLSQGVAMRTKSKDGTKHWDAVTLALGNKNPEILKALLRGKAEFDKATVICSAWFDKKYHVSPEHIKYLVFAGAELNTLCKENYGGFFTPLAFFTYANQPRTAEMLLALGADGRIKNNNGQTAYAVAPYELKKHPVYNQLLDAQFNAPRKLTPELAAERDAFIAYINAGTPATPVQTATAPAITAPAPTQTAPAPATAPTPSYPTLQSTGKPILMGHMVSAQNKNVELDIQILATGETLTALRIDNIGGEPVLWRSDGQEKALPIQVRQGDTVLAKGDAPIAMPLGDKESLVRVTFADNAATFVKSGAKFRLTAFFASGNRAMAMFTVP